MSFESADWDFEILEATFKHEETKCSSSAGLRALAEARTFTAP